MLQDTAEKIKDSIIVTNDISSQIKEAGEDVAKRTQSVADGTKDIKAQVQDSAEKVAGMTETASEMKSLSEENAENVHSGNSLVSDLSDKMQTLENTMSAVSGAVAQAVLHILTEQVYAGKMRQFCFPAKNRWLTYKIPPRPKRHTESKDTHKHHFAFSIFSLYIK